MVVIGPGPGKIAGCENQNIGQKPGQRKTSAAAAAGLSIAATAIVNIELKI